MNYSDLTLLTVSYNNNILTGMMLKSFYKMLNNYDIKIVIVDNGDQIPVDDNIKSIFTVIDNFNHKIIPKQENPSREHAASIDYAFKHVIDTKWCLLVDNDILFKENIKTLFDTLDLNKFDCMGEIGWDCTPPDRLFPYMCLINIEKFKQDNLNYYDRNRIIYDWKKLNKYDTGFSFYEDIKNTWIIKNIKLSDYIIHLKSGTLQNKDYLKWLKKYKNNY